MAIGDDCSGPYIDTYSKRTMLYILLSYMPAMPHAITARPPLVLRAERLKQVVYLVELGIIIIAAAVLLIRDVIPRIAYGREQDVDLGPGLIGIAVLFILLDYVVIARTARAFRR